MQNRKPLYVVIFVGLLIITSVLYGLFKSDNRNGSDSSDVLTHNGVAGEPLDVALDFYDLWLAARNSTTTNPYSENLTKAPGVSQALEKKLNEAKTIFDENGFDPVLCQNGIPTAFRVKTVFEQGEEAQMLIMPKEKEGGIQALVSLKSFEGLWEISDISCGSSELPPEQGEFNFDQEGFLLKQSVKPPLDSQYWHLIFTQAGVLGYTTPLFLSTDSVCISADGKEEVCSDNLLSETMKVRAQGDMTESGLMVKRLELDKK